MEAASRAAATGSADIRQPLHPIDKSDIIAFMNYGSVSGRQCAPCRVEASESESGAAKVNFRRANPVNQAIDSVAPYLGLCSPHATQSADPIAANKHNRQSSRTKRPGSGSQFVFYQGV